MIPPLSSFSPPRSVETVTLQEREKISIWLCFIFPLCLKLQLTTLWKNLFPFFKEKYFPPFVSGKPQSGRAEGWMPENDYFLPLPPTQAAERKSGRTNVISHLKRRGGGVKKSAFARERERENFSFSRSVSPGLYYFFPFFARKERGRRWKSQTW